MNWQSIISSVASVAVLVLPAAIAHYKKLGNVFSVVTKILDSVNSAETITKNTAPPSRPGGGMVNDG